MDGTVELRPLETFSPSAGASHRVGLYEVSATVVDGANRFGFSTKGDGWDGWFWVEDFELKEAWTSEEGGYVDSVSGARVELGEGEWKVWLLTVTDGGYQTTFLPKDVERPTRILVRGWVD